MTAGAGDDTIAAGNEVGRAASLGEHALYALHRTQSPAGPQFSSNDFSALELSLRGSGSPARALRGTSYQCRWRMPASARVAEHINLKVGTNGRGEFDPQEFIAPAWRSEEVQRQQRVAFSWEHAHVQQNSGSGGW
jgi:hypothetical protein